MRYLLLFFLFGISTGLWISWPGILSPNNWKCFNYIIAKSADEKISIKAALATPPNYLFRRKKKKNISSKIRIVSDACFR